MNEVGPMPTLHLAQGGHAMDIPGQGCPPKHSILPGHFPGLAVWAEEE